MKEYYKDNHRTLYNKSCTDMSEIPDETIQCVVTSPPYWGLRKYSGEQDLIWGDSDCVHKWQITPPRRSRKSSDIVNLESKEATNGGNLGIELPTTNTCQLCGAWRGAYGLEPTPEMYVSHTIQILREIRRVLREDGVCFLNIGDSYFGGGNNRGNNSPISNKQASNQGAIGQNAEHQKNIGKHDTIKPKDLCLIPFRVALEAQKPYYTGRIKDEKDRIWLASMIDGEGCMFIHKRKVGQNNGQGYKRKHDSYGAGLEVANTHYSIIERCQRITGIGSICRVERETKSKKRNIPLYRWNVRSNQCRDIVKEIYPYLVGKQHEARLLLGCPSSGTDAEKAHESLIALYNGKEASIDFKPPESMYEPGWYVRSIIIWSKKNPMPESVKDRPTEAHEYILMLTKSSRYYWDQDAVRETSVDPESYTGRRPRNINTIGKVDPENYAFMGSVDENGKLRYGQTYPERNLRSVWTFPTQPYPEAHFAVFPEKLPEICIKAASKVGDIILDPFAGAGTTLKVATELNRKAIGYELSTEYCELISERNRQQVLI